MDEMYKRIRDGLNRWMRIAGMSRRDELRGGIECPSFGWIC